MTPDARSEVCKARSMCGSKLFRGGHGGFQDGSVEKHDISKIRFTHKTPGYQLRASEVSGGEDGVCGIHGKLR